MFILLGVNLKNQKKNEVQTEGDVGGHVKV